MKTNHLEMMRVTLEASENLPAARRVKVLQGLADVCGDQIEAEKLRQQAAILAAADDLCREFNFNFVQTNKA
jgi:hypothetical protein